MSDQGNGTSELTKVLMELVSPNGKLVTVAGAKQRIERLISQEAARLAREVIGKTETQEYTPEQTKGDDGLELIDKLRYIAIRNSLRAEQRRRLDALQGGTKG